MLKSKRSRACDIPQAVKREVWIRDNQKCVLCGTHYAVPNAHFVSRLKGGLGVARNVVTLCFDCHRRYDQSTERKVIREYLKKYLQSKYADWNEESLYYKRWRND